MLRKGISALLLILFLSNHLRGSELVKINKEDYTNTIKYIQAKPPIIQAILFDFNQCQTCLIGLPMLIQASDSSIFIAVSGVSQKNRAKLATKWKIPETRILFISADFKKALPENTIYLEISEKSDYCMVYSHSELGKVKRITEPKKKLEITSEIILNFFEKTVCQDSFVFSITNPTQDFVSYNINSHELKEFNKRLFDSFYWNTIFENEALLKSNSSLLKRSEAIAFLKEHHSGSNLFYPINLDIYADTLYIAMQPLMVHKKEKNYTVKAILVVLKLDFKLNILGYEKVNTGQVSSGIIGFGVTPNHFFLGNFDSSEYLLSRNQRNTNIRKRVLKYKPLEKYKGMIYSGNGIHSIKDGVVTMQDYPIIYFMKDTSSLIDFSQYLGLKLSDKTLFRNKYVRWNSIKKELFIICQVNRYMVQLKFVKGELKGRRFNNLAKKFNSSVSINTSNHSFSLLYQNVDGFFKETQF